MAYFPNLSSACHADNGKGPVLQSDLKSFSSRQHESLSSLGIALSNSSRARRCSISTPVSQNWFAGDEASTPDLHGETS